MTEAEDNIEDSSAPLVEHLAELRDRLIKCVAAMVIGFLIMFYFSREMLDFLAQPVIKILEERGADATFIFTAAQEQFFTQVRIAFITGLGIAFPVIAYQLWSFVAPGLYRNEKNAFLPFVIASPVLFLLGASFAHYIVTPLALRFFIGFGDIVPALATLFGANDLPFDATREVVEEVEEGLKTSFVPKLNENLDLAIKFIFAFGLCFQLPVLLSLLGKAGLVSAQGLRDVRKYAIVGILVLAALVTPPDVVTQLILFTVVYGLYEVSIWLVAWIEKRRNDELREMGILDEEDDEGDVN